MVPVMDNSPYHHVCVIPYLASFSKKGTAKLMKEHGIDNVLIPMTDEQISLLPEQYNTTINNGHLQISFEEEELQRRKAKSNALKTPSSK